jgi:hypothetical protein
LDVKRNDNYVDMDGNIIPLGELDAEEKRLVSRLRRRAQTHPDWCDFDNYWMRAVAEFYDGRGLRRSQSVKSVPFQIAQDLSSRIAVASGFARPSDYRDELEEIIRTRFPTRRAFCKATGISEDLLSHVLAGRKDLSLATLTQGLERIGYRLRITPGPERKRTG